MGENLKALWVVLGAKRSKTEKERDRSKQRKRERERERERANMHCQSIACTRLFDLGCKQKTSILNERQIIF
jgi:hypothetical protein